jgi:hypothetical protein
MSTFIKYRDTVVGYVTSEQLQTLLESKKIISFQRSGKWVDLGSEPLRGNGSCNEYNGPNRRRSGKY